MRSKLYLTLFAALALAGYLSRFGFWFDLTTHFQPQYLIGLLACAGFCAWQRRWRTMAVAVICAAIPLSRILPLYMPLTRTAHAGPASTLSLLLVNIKAENRQFEKLRAYIRESDPDIIALEEFNELWHNELSPVLKDYPYTIHEFREDNFGIGLYSRLPVENLKIKRFSDVPSISGDLTVNGRPLTVLVTHPIPPVRPSAFRYRNRHFANMAAARGEYHDNLVLIGDLNSSSWSYFFQKLAADMGLRDSREGFGLQFSWPTMTALLLTTIDHALVSDNIVVNERRIGKDIGSDHFPVYLEIGVSGPRAVTPSAN